MQTARLCAVALLVLGSSLATEAAFADVSPICSQFDTNYPCTQAEVGNACANGGTCRAIFCSQQGMMLPATIYRCVACPELIEEADAGTDGGTVCAGALDFGKACGAGGRGTCGRAPAHCAYPGYVQCLGATPILPPYDGGPGPSSDAGPTSDAGFADVTSDPIDDGGDGSSPPGDDGGCSVAARSLRRSIPALVSPFLLAIGAGALLVDRRRRKQR